MVFNLCSTGYFSYQYCRNVANNRRYHVRHRPWLLQAGQLQRSHGDGVVGGGAHQ